MLRFGVLLILLGSVEILSAQSVKPDRMDSIFQLKEVVVTATKKQTESPLVPYSVNKITAEQFNLFQFRTAPEAFLGSTGVFVQKTNHGGGSPFVRALTGNQNLWMIDGVRMNNSTYRYGPNQYFNTVDIYNVSAVEVVRGSGSVQYGSDAMGGVIQVFTKEPQFAKKAQWSSVLMGKAVSAGMEYSGNASVVYQSPAFAFELNSGLRNFGDLKGGDTTGFQSPSGYHEQSFNGKLRWAVKKNTMLTLSHQYMVQHDVPLYHKVKLENFKEYFFEPQLRKLSYLKLEQITGKQVLNKITLIASAQQNKEVRKYEKNGASYRFKESDAIATFGLTAEIASDFSKNWTANSGVEYYHDKVNSAKEQIAVSNAAILAQRGLYPDNSSTRNFSIYSLHHLVLNKIRLEAGVRYNHFVIAIQDTSNSALKLGSVQVKPSSWVSNWSFLYSLSSNHTIYTSFSTGYRAPNIDDMGTLGLVDFRYEIPAYNLKPEKSYNTEIGYKYNGKNWRGAVSVFYMKLADLITRVQVPGRQIGGYNVYQKENSQESYVKGIELENRFKLSSQFKLEMNACYLFGQNSSKNEPLRRVPPFNGSVALSYSLKKLGLIWESVYAAKQDRLAQGDKDDNRIPAGGTPGWYIMNIYAGYQLPGISFNAGLMNLLNEDYRTHGSGINGAGRTLSATVRIKF